MKKLTTILLSLFCMQMAFAYDMKDEVTLEPLCGDEITFEAQAETGYHFIGWSDGVMDPVRTFVPNQDSTITAYFEIDTCVIIFYNSDSTVIKTITLEYGQNIYNVRPDDPTIPESKKEPGHEYGFSGWDPYLGADQTVPAKTDTLRYYATYSDIMLDYPIHFVNWDNTPIKDITLKYGTKLDTCSQVPGFGGKDVPEKPENDTCSFVFKGWNPTLATVTGEATYVAVYDTVYFLFNVVVRVDETIASVSKTPGQYGTDQYHYGDSVEITVYGIDNCYQFVNWIYTDDKTQFTDKVTYKFAIHEDMDLTAILERIKFTIQVKSSNGSQGKVGGQVNPLQTP